MTERRDLRSELRREWRAAAEDYWSVLTGGHGWSDHQVNERARRLAKVALRLHIFEQGRRNKR